MNKIVDKFLPGDTFVPEMHLKQPGFTYSACSQFTKNKEIIKKFIQTGDFIFKNDVNKDSFQHDMAYGKSNDLAIRTESETFLRDKVFQIPSNPKYDGYQRRLVSMVYKFFGKKSRESDVATVPSY